MDHIGELFGASQDIEQFARGYVDYVAQVTRSIDPTQIAACLETLIEARASGRTVFVAGNGGSASTASHFANDLAIGTKCDPGFSVVSLVDNVSILTAVANDYSYEDVFVRQLRLLARAGDVFLAISVSGNSPNVLKALKWAKDNDLRTIGWSGFDGGELMKQVEVVVHAPTVRAEYGPAEDAHMILAHLVCGYLFHSCRAGTER